MLREWERKFPGRVDNLFRALGNVVPSHLLDRKLYPFETLRAGGRPQGDGPDDADLAFDDEPIAGASPCGPAGLSIAEESCDGD